MLIYDPDRLARRYSYQELVMDELQEAGVEVMFVTVPTPKNSGDKIVHGVRGLFAEYERAKISERFRLGKLRKVREGHILVSEPLYGYSYIPKQDTRHGYYEISPEEARTVKMIFSWVADEGMTLRGVVRRLQEMKIKPRKSKRGVWSTSTLSTLLRNRAYIGEAHWGSSFAVVPDNPLKNEKYKKIKKSSRRKRPRDEWITIPVPAIIALGVFEKAGRQLQANFTFCQRNKKNEYLLAGKIECVCGRKRAGEGVWQGKHLYYRCADRIYSFPLPHTCKEKGINARIADQLVWQKIAGLMSSPKLLIEQAKRWFKSRQTKTTAGFVDIAALKTEIEKLKGQEERYNKAYGAQVFTLEQLQAYTAPIKEKVAALGGQIATATREANQNQVNALPGQSEIQAFAEKAKLALQDLNFGAKRAILLNTVEKIIGTKQLLQVSGYIPLIQNVEYKTNDRHRWPAQRRKIYPVQRPDQPPG